MFILSNEALKSEGQFNIVPFSSGESESQSILSELKRYSALELPSEKTTFCLSDECKVHLFKIISHLVDSR